jgi:NADP-dependent 3-hydroxy acid dehydrogenase YdfG
VLQADMTDQGQVVDAVERPVSELSRVDTAVNTTDVMLLRPAQDTPTGEWDEIAAINSPSVPLWFDQPAGSRGYARWPGMLVRMR